jgi:hypothetical protein
MKLKFGWGSRKSRKPSTPAPPRAALAEIRGKLYPIGTVLQNYKGQYGMIVGADSHGQALIRWPLTKEQIEYAIGEPLNGQVLTEEQAEKAMAKYLESCDGN